MASNSHSTAPLLARWFGYIYSEWDAERRVPVMMVRWRGKHYRLKEGT